MKHSEIRSKYQKYIIDLNNFQCIKNISSGSFGSVYSVQDKKTKNIYAAKVLISHDDESNYKKMIIREIGIMIQCNHPSIIKFLGYSYEDFNNLKNVTILMEFAQKGSLAELLKNVKNRSLNDKYDNTNRQIILIGIAGGMMYLHQQKIIHRDLKPGNILLDENLHPHITDFGLSKVFEDRNSMVQSQHCGTSAYMAPEVIDGENYDIKADVYSFGIIMFQVVTDLIPYPLLNNGKLKPFKFNQLVADNDYRPEFTVDVKKSIKKLITRCWSKDPNERPSFSEIFKKLAYGIEDSFEDIYDDQKDDEDEGNDENKYYLEDVDIDAIVSYANEISDQTSLQDEDGTIVNSTINNKSFDDIVTNLKTENEDLRNKIEELKETFEKMITASNNKINEILNENKKMKEQINDNRIKLKKLNEKVESTSNENKNHEFLLELESDIRCLKYEVIKLKERSIETPVDNSADINSLKDNMKELEEAHIYLKHEVKQLKSTPVSEPIEPNEAVDLSQIEKDLRCLKYEVRRLKQQQQQQKEPISSVNNEDERLSELEEARRCLKHEVKQLKSTPIKERTSVLPVTITDDLLDDLKAVELNTDTLHQEGDKFKSDLIYNKYEVKKLKKQSKPAPVAERAVKAPASIPDDLLDRLSAAEKIGKEAKKKANSLQKLVKVDLSSLKYETKKKEQSAVEILTEEGNPIKKELRYTVEKDQEENLASLTLSKISSNFIEECKKDEEKQFNRTQDEENEDRKNCAPSTFETLEKYKEKNSKEIVSFNKVKCFKNRPNFPEIIAETLTKKSENAAQSIEYEQQAKTNDESINMIEKHIEKDLYNNRELNEEEIFEDERYKKEESNEPFFKVLSKYDDIIDHFGCKYITKREVQKEKNIRKKIFKRMKKEEELEYLNEE